VAISHRDGPTEIVAVADVAPAVRDRLTRPRPLLRRLFPAVAHHRAAVMGILNVTPDSFSDGGRHAAPEAAQAAARTMAAAGADLIDIGAESTRPGAAPVDLATERARLAGVLPGLAGLAWSIDTRKAAVMADALAAGASLINDVSALGHDPAALALVAASNAPVVLMHAQGDPQTMQQSPHYDDALFDVFDWLAARIATCEDAGIARDRIIVDPGIGFGKTLDHNLALLRGLALFHDLGVPVLLGASRKQLISRMVGAVPPDERLPGSLALALHAAAHGVQIVRVHDVAATVQALSVWHSATALR
jgi:dihydropteroate synthase